MAHFTRTLEILTDGQLGYFGDERDPLRPTAPPAVDDAPLDVADSPDDGTDPLDLDPHLCDCGSALWHYAGESYCPDCTAFGMGKAPWPAA